VAESEKGGAGVGEAGAGGGERETAGYKPVEIEAHNLHNLEEARAIEGLTGAVAVAAVRNTPLLGPYSRTIPRALWWC